MTNVSPIRRPSVDRARGAGSFDRFRLTLGVLVLYRLGCFIPVPGLNPDAVARLGAGSGLALERVSIMALGLVPLLTVWVLFELVKTFFPSLARWQAADKRHAALLSRMLLGCALLDAAFQGMAIATAMENLNGLVAEPGGSFRMEAAASLVAAVAALAWLADRLPLAGLGNGFWLLLTVPVLAALPSRAYAMIELTRSGAIGAGALALAGVFLVFSVAALVVGAATRDRRDLFADIWPSMLGAATAGVAMIAFALVFDHDLAAVASPRYGFGGGVHLATLATLIAFFAWARARNSGGASVWPVTLAQILVCVGGEWLTVRLGMPVELGGVWLVAVTAVALSAAYSILPSKNDVATAA